MAQEIERKFLVLNNLYKVDAHESGRIIQGYLTSDPERSVRVRIKGDSGFITVKGAVNASGVSRFEWEKKISLGEAEALLNICLPGVIDKIRYEIKYGDHIFEVDEFSEDNKGLVIAEIELMYEEQDFLKPDWLGIEVTGDKKYYNSMLVRYPFNTW
jgi:adenylate cyclase